MICDVYMITGFYILVVIDDFVEVWVQIDCVGRKRQPVNKRQKGCDVTAFLDDRTFFFFYILVTCAGLFAFIFVRDLASSSDMVFNHLNSAGHVVFP